MSHHLHFASSSRLLDRRTHARLLAGLLFGLTTAGSAISSASAATSGARPTDTALWNSAVQIARASRWFFPGRAVIEETATRDKTTARTRVTARLENENGGEPAVAVTEVRLGDQDLTSDRAEDIAATLTPLLETLYRPDHPLALHSAEDARPVGEKDIDGFRCRGFATRSELDGVAVEMTTWIDVSRGFARRIDFHAVNLPIRKDGAVLRALVGTAEYTLDAENRWLLVRHREHSDLRAPVVLSNVEIRADRTITCDGHWEYRGPRRDESATASITTP
ncbi:MAG TPA: hypothetical protein VK163_10455 [Opitutaceae bacterium]|nr:hypothetical protein [Opitutaceae bacterium]